VAAASICALVAASGSPAAATATRKHPSRAAPECRDSNVRSRYFGTQEGAGSDFGGFVVWNTSADPCRLATRGTITPVLPSSAGAILHFTFHKRLVLSARAPRPRNGYPPQHAVEASFSISGEYRDGTGPHGLCSRRHEVVPTRWLLRDGSVHLSIHNGAAEPRSEIPDGSNPSSGRKPQPVESCGNEFHLGYAGRYG
jgi:hypothetical protein